MGAGIPSPPATPIKATPMVPAVPQDVPVASDVIEHMIKDATRNICGEIIFSP